MTSRIGEKRNLFVSAFDEAQFLAATMENSMDGVMDVGNMDVQAVNKSTL